MKPIPLFGTGVRSYSEIVTRQRRLNCFYDMRNDGDRSSTVVVGTPGSRVFATLPTSPVYGMHTVGETLYVVAGTVLYAVAVNGTVSTLGSLPTTANAVSMDDNSLQLLIVDGVAGYIYNISTSTFTGVITDSNFPNGTTSITCTGSVFIAQNPNTRQFLISALLDGTTWTPQVYATKEQYSDLLAAVKALNGTLLLLGKLSTEFWQNVGTSPNPFQLILGSTQTWGLVAPRSYAAAAGTAMFLGVNADGAVRVCIIEGLTITPVSDSDIDSILETLAAAGTANVASATAFCFSTYGHSFYVLNLPVANRTLCYDIKTHVWHEMQTGLAPQAVYFGSLGVTFNGGNYVADINTGNIYFLDEEVYTDNGAPIPREICTRHIRNAGNEFFLDQLMLDFETGVGNDEVTAPQVFISISRDGGRTFGPEKFKPLGLMGAYLDRVVFNRNGSGRDLVIKIRVTDAVKFVITGGSAASYEVSDG